MDFDRLNAFRAVAMEGNFSRAAERLFKTQPAISQAVRALEEELGERLLVRQGRTTTLTQAGRILLEQADRATEALDVARARIQGLRELTEGELVLATSDTTACYALPDVLRAYRSRYPGVEVRIANRPSPVAAAQVASREADLAIVTLPVTHPKLESESLAVREDVAICAPGHALARRRRISLVDLAAHPLLLLDHGANTRSFIDAQFAEAGLTPRVSMELGSIEVIKRLVQLDFGVSVVPGIAVRDETRRGALHAIRVFDRSACRAMGIVYPKTGIASPAAVAFADLLRKRLTRGAAL
ncbi:MAG: LysR family transcriptional regulator [bacterium]|nr:LysR family transcriptional regulator [bacterium]